MSTALRAVVLALTVGVGLWLLRSGMYGWTLFVVVPMLLGGLGAWIAGPRTAGSAAAVGGFSAGAATFALLLIGIEGLACVAMALPLTIAFGAIGGLLFHRPTPIAAMFLILPPASVTYDLHAHPPLYAVRTTIEIAAPAEVVWKNVIAFPELPPPGEWYFHTGLAYPIRARIEGNIRYCDFTTGSFVEPIEIADAPRLLRFRVIQNPAPMHEWSPYGPLDARHLHGYLVSKHGQFLLTPIDATHTRLEGTTWYQHGLWPAEYWRWWSDAIIHRIHLRVLNHIRALSEANTARTSARNFVTFADESPAPSVSIGRYPR